MTSDFTKEYNRRVIEEVSAKLINYYADPNKKERKEKGLCKFCMYYMNTRVGGCAITTKQCDNCKEEMVFGTTAVDKFCINCAKKLKQCKQCGQKMD